jgi:acetyl-CoA acetyltransferase
MSVRSSGLSRSPRRPMAPVHVVGIAATPFLPEHDAMLDELVFDAVQAALREAGLRKQDAGLAVTASMDVLDARSISAGLTVMASGGYLNDSYRLEGDSGIAITAAAQAVAAGDVEVAIAVGVHNPETRSSDAAGRRGFTEQVSNLGFEPVFDRPVGLTAETIYGLHASYAVEQGRISLEEMAGFAAEEISRGADLGRSVRRSVASAGDVLSSPGVMWPLHDLMLPGHSTGAVAVVLASPARAGRCRGRSARITGLGHATGSYTWTADWLSDAGAPTRRAAERAYGLAGLDDPGEAIGYAEISAPTPALHAEYLNALGLASSLRSKDVNASGGMRSNYPGLANGGLRLLEAMEQLERRSGGSRAVSHSVDTLTGSVSEDVTVLVVEAA